MPFNETKLIHDFLHALQRRLPYSWKVQPTECGSEVGRMVSFHAPDGASASLLLTVTKQLDPRDVPALILKLRQRAMDKTAAYPFVIAPYLSPRTRELLFAEGTGYWDETGNVRLVLDKPAVFIEGNGATKNPSPDSRALQSLRGRAAGRAIRALCDFHPPYGVRQLAVRSKTPAPSLSRVIDLLLREALIKRATPRGPISDVDWQALLRRWAQDYDFTVSNHIVACLEPRGLGSFFEKLRTTPVPYVLSGTFAAEARGATVAASRLAVCFIRDQQEAIYQLKLKEAATGANVLLAEPFDSVVFERTQQIKGIEYAAPTQVVADLLTGPGRSPADGEALLEWMKENEHEWRT